MQNDKEMLGTAPIGKLLFKLALPTVVAQLINMLYNIVDRIYIGHMPEGGDLALTGVGVCMPIIMLVSAFAALVSSGGAPRASIFMGKKDMESAEKTLGGCFTLQIIVSVILTVVLLIWNEDLLLAFGASQNTIQYATEYMDIYAVGTIFVQLTLGMNAFITAQGFTKISMASVLIGAVANIILDPIFIYGFDMGVGGAALATIISQGFSCIWVVAFLFGKKTLLATIKKYQPESTSKSSGQVLTRPYTYDETRIIVMEMVDKLVLELFELGYNTDQIVLNVGYDIENLTDPERRAAYKGPIVKDRYGREIPKYAESRINLGKHTCSTKLITAKTLELYERIVDKKLLTRRLTISANHLLTEEEAKASAGAEQLTLFDAPEDIAQREADEEKEKRMQKAILEIKNRFGPNAVMKGTSYQDAATGLERNMSIGGHKG